MTKSKIDLFRETMLCKITKDQRQLERVSYFSEVKWTLFTFFVYHVLYDGKFGKTCDTVYVNVLHFFPQNIFISIILIFFLIGIRAYYSHLIFEKTAYNYIASQWQC